MIIIGFSCKTSKILPRVLCRHFRHVAPIFIGKNYLILYQFVRWGRIEKIKLNLRDIKILTRHGWVFVYLPGVPTRNFHKYTTFTCVQLVKRTVGIQTIGIQTPDALYKKLKGLEL